MTFVLIHAFVKKHMVLMQFDDTLALVCILNLSRVCTQVCATNKQEQSHVRMCANAAAQASTLATHTHTYTHMQQANKCERVRVPASVCACTQGHNHNRDAMDYD